MYIGSLVSRWWMVDSTRQLEIINRFRIHGNRFSYLWYLVLLGTKGGQSISHLFRSLYRCCREVRI